MALFATYGINQGFGTPLPPPPDEGRSIAKMSEAVEVLKQGLARHVIEAETLLSG